jgi:hypothetical protein
MKTPSLAPYACKWVHYNRCLVINGFEIQARVERDARGIETSGWGVWSAGPELLKVFDKLEDAIDWAVSS